MELDFICGVGFTNIPLLMELKLRAADSWISILPERKTYCFPLLRIAKIIPASRGANPPARIIPTQCRSIKENTSGSRLIYPRF